jgi:membrane associated rhomboid family serine protease
MFNFASQTPVNTLTWIVLVVVYVGTHGVGADPAQRVSERRRDWGSVEQLSWVKTDGSREDVISPELTGPFELWDGQWWRVPLTALHHADLLHLAMNLTFVLVCGPWLEQRWGGWRYLVFLIAAAFVSMAPEYLLGNHALGYSGVCCAIFGALLALRTRDAELQERMPEEWVSLMLGTLVAMLALTWADVLPIANAAHFTGLGYGLLAGAVSRLAWPARSAFVLGHALLVVPYWLMVSPTWNGRYQWYLADLERRENLSEPWNVARLKRAVAADPSLTEVWLILSQDALDRNQPLEGWDLLLQGLEHNPSQQELWGVARRMWRLFATSEDRPRAVKVVTDRFGSSGAGWLSELRRTVPPPVLIAPDRAAVETPLNLLKREIRFQIHLSMPPAMLPIHTVVAESSKPLQRNWEPPPQNAWPWRVPSNEPLPAVDPADPNSAVEGELL